MSRIGALDLRDVADRKKDRRLGERVHGHVQEPSEVRKRPAPAEGKKGKKGNAELINLPARRNVLPEERQSQLKLLIARGKEQGYLTYAQVNDHLPSEIVDPEQIEDIVNTINDMGIPVYEKAPDTESLLQTEPSQPADEEAIEEAAAALAALDAELGRTTDPVRMYMRELGTVELLTREGEIREAWVVDYADQLGDRSVIAGTCLVAAADRERRESDRDPLQRNRPRSGGDSYGSAMFRVHRPRTCWRCGGGSAIAWTRQARPASCG